MIYLELFFTFLMIGTFTFGGGYAMLPAIQEQVMAHGWMEVAELVDFIAISESTPGPLAVNVATFVGANTAGVLGGLCATLGVVLPSFVIILIIAHCFKKFQNSTVVQGCMRGLKPTVVGLIGAAVISIGETAFFYNGFSTDALLCTEFFTALAVFAICGFAAIKKLHPIAIICLSALIGIGAHQFLI